MLIVVGWSLAVVSITLNVLYVKTNPKVPNYLIQEYALNEVDLLLYFAVSILAGAFLADLDRIFLGYILSLFLFVFLTTVISFFFVWFNLGWGEYFLDIPFGWEWIVYYALLRIVRITFPFVLLLSLLGAILGGILADYFRTEISPYLKDIFPVKHS